MNPDTTLERIEELCRMVQDYIHWINRSNQPED